MKGSTYFSASYAEARSRFRRAARAAGALVESHPLPVPGPDGQPLTIDTARLGPAPARAVVGVTSATHGVEGFFGSAVQLALLDEPPELGDDTALLLVHAVNPYGFAFVRRVNEANVDLNRSFLPEGEAYDGAPAGYAELDALLNPPRPPTRLAAASFPVQAGLQIARRGFGTLKGIVAGGQYTHPKGLFYGGSGPSHSQRVLEEQASRWLDGAEHVLVVDFHTGLGPRATYKLLVDCPLDSTRGRWMCARFGADAVQPWADDGVAYDIRGGLGTWLKGRFPGIELDVLAAEFGTVSALRVITALSMENRAHHWDTPGARSTRRAKRALMEAFAPASPAWRGRVVAQGCDIVRQALEAV